MPLQSPGGPACAREDVALVCECSRVLLGAIFATAHNAPKSKHHPYADKALLSRFSRERWVRFAALCNSPRGDASQRTALLVECEGRIQILVRPRMVATRPSVYWMLTAVLGDSVDESVLSDLYRDNVCREYGLKDTSEFLRFAQDWIARFSEIQAREVRRAKLLNLVPGERWARWSLGLVEMLESLAILQFTAGKDGDYRVPFHADTAFVFQNIFGRGSGSEGMNALLMGGIVSPSGTEGDNLTTVISGPPGMGKSTLALGLSMQAAARGALALYFRFEPSESTVERQVTQYYRRLLPFVTMPQLPVKASKVLAGMDGKEWDGRGLFLTSDIMATPIEAIQDAAFELSGYECVKRFPERIAVFDSISSAPGYQQQAPLWRKFLFETAALLRSRGFAAVFVVERNQGEDADFEDYVSDLDIRLTYSNPAAHNYRFRMVEIVKSRMQASHRGPHPYSIDTGIGIRVFPSSAAVLAARTRRSARLKSYAGGELDPGVCNFARYFCKKSSDDGSVSWWHPGSVTALIGPRGTLKSAFALSFAQKEDTRQQDLTACSLSLNFADEFVRNFRRDEQRRVPVGIRYDVPIGGNGTHSYVLFRSGYVAPGHVLETVRAIIAEKRRDGMKITRAVVTDTGNIASSFPALADDPMFLSALCLLLTSEGISTVLVYSRPDHPTGDRILDQVRSISDNIIQFQIIEYAGADYTAIHVERSAEAAHDRSVCELRSADKTLEVVPTFDLVVDIHSGKPAPAPVKIMLYAGTALQRKHHENVQRLHHSIGAYEVLVLDEVMQFAHHGLPKRALMGGRALWIIQFDAYGLSRVSRGGQVLASLCDLSSLSTRLRHADSEFVCPPPWSHGVVSVPYYLNPSFLALHEAFVEYSTVHFPAIARGTWEYTGEYSWREYSWRDLIQTAAEFRRENVAYAQCPLFGFSEESDETVNCLFLEILASLNPDALNSTGSGGWNSEDTLRNAVRVYLDLFEGDGKPPRRQGDAYVTPLVTRNWYTGYCQLQHDLRQIGLPGVVPARLPGGYWSSGDWHLGILEGSIGIRQGIHIILDELVTRPGAMALLADGVGLPPFKDFYTESKPPSPASSMFAPSWFRPYTDGDKVIYRALIPEYCARATDLSFYLRALRAARHGDATTVEQIVSRMIEVLKLPVRRDGIGE